MGIPRTINPTFPTSYKIFDDQMPPGFSPILGMTAGGQFGNPAQIGGPSGVRPPTIPGVGMIGGVQPGTPGWPAYPNDPSPAEISRQAMSGAGLPSFAQGQSFRLSPMKDFFERDGKKPHQPEEWPSWARWEFAVGLFVLCLIGGFLCDIFLRSEMSGT